MNIDNKWEDNRKKAVNIIYKIDQAMKEPRGDRDSCLPADLENPETQTEVDAVNQFATSQYELASDLMGVFEDMMCGDEVQKKFDDIHLELYGPRDQMHEAGFTEGQF